MVKKVLLWQGCNYRKNLPNDLNNIFTLFNKLNIEVTTLEEELCCGFPLIIGGFRNKAKKNAKEIIETLNRFNLVVTPCPACQRAFKEFYMSKLGLKIKPGVVHVTQFLWGLIKKGKIKPKFKHLEEEKVMYHDPCELGRHMEVYEEPRKIISLIPNVKLYKPKYTKEKSICCGGGGLLASFFPTLSVKIAARKLIIEDEIPKDLKLIVTACPQCILTIRRAVDIFLNREMKVTNVSGLLIRFLT